MAKIPLRPVRPPMSQPVPGVYENSVCPEPGDIVGFPGNDKEHIVRKVLEDGRICLIGRDGSLHPENLVFIRRATSNTDQGVGRTAPTPRKVQQQFYRGSSVHAKEGDVVAFASIVEDAGPQAAQRWYVVRIYGEDGAAVDLEGDSDRVTASRIRVEDLVFFKRKPRATYHKNFRGPELGDVVRFSEASFGERVVLWVSKDGDRVDLGKNLRGDPEILKYIQVGVLDLLRRKSTPPTISYASGEIPLPGDCVVHQSDPKGASLIVGSIHPNGKLLRIRGSAQDIPIGVWRLYARPMATPDYTHYASGEAPQVGDSVETNGYHGVVTSIQGTSVTIHQQMGRRMAGPVHLLSLIRRAPDLDTHEGRVEALRVLDVVIHRGDLALSQLPSLIAIGERIASNTKERP